MLLAARKLTRADEGRRNAQINRGRWGTTEGLSGMA
jgi:hypothetical protein